MFFRSSPAVGGGTVQTSSPFNLDHGGDSAASYQLGDFTTSFTVAPRALVNDRTTSFAVAVISGRTASCTSLFQLAGSAHAARPIRPFACPLETYSVIARAGSFETSASPP